MGGPGSRCCGPGPLVPPRPLTLLQLGLSLTANLVLTGGRRAPSSGIRIAVRSVPEPGLVRVLQQPTGQPVLEHLLITFSVGLPSRVFEFLHVLGADPLGHHRARLESV